MPECLACLGDGHHDFREMDAFIGEHTTDAMLISLREAGMTHPLGIVPCEECEGTGVISHTRYKELWAAAMASVDQVIARDKSLERPQSEPPKV